MAQEEAQARYKNMPQSAIDTGQVDYVLPVEKMPAELIKYIKHPYIRCPEKTSSARGKYEDHVQEIFLLIRSGTGHDFSQYKRNTIHRRIEKRMALHQFDQISDYVHYLRENPAEIKTLLKDILITVTAFFRDPAASKALKEKVVLPLLKAKPPHDNIRVWVAGCATGEEVYSIAILFAEAMQTVKKHFNIQIFATDLDSKSIEYARQGLYPKSIVTDVSSERIKQFFIKEEDGFKIKKHIREMIVFATQNMIKDPPFSKLDLISCRNVLIYMDAALQKKVLPLFHYTLNPGGFLFLGTSEGIGNCADRFSPVDKKWRIFKRKEVFTEMGIRHPIEPLNDTETKAAGASKKASPSGACDIRQLAERTILLDYSSPCVLVDDHYNILYFNGETDKYLTLPKGEPDFNLLKMVRKDLRYKLNTLLVNATKEKKTIVSEGLKIRHNDDYLIINLEVRPLLEPSMMETYLMVIFESKATKTKADPKKKKAATDDTFEPRVTVLEQELQSTKEYLQTTIEELEISNEELKSTNEEMQSTNEELQSTNEELETSREELQSTNEELQTVNSELQNKVDQLSDVNNDLNNLISNTRIATIFLDNDICIKRFTESSTNIFNLINTDIGRPISDISHNLKYHDLLTDLKQVLDHLGRVEKELESQSGLWFNMCILPYRTLENSIDGVVVTFNDITAQKTNEFASKEATAFAEGIIDTMREPIIVLDDELRIIYANGAFYKTFKVKPEDTLKTRIYDLGNKQWNIPELKHLLEEILPKDTQLKDFEVVHNFPDIGHKKMVLNASRILRSGKGTETILLAIEDITARKDADK